ncbi:EAL domain-containing protein [Henriciella aquimarina]|uniref:EAL domain-containing protein n=1 Tax=Henriciella aquimarina TaxID=545261 RepID=UPI000A01A9B6|nr:EAL domain-containing protein [Henriciella aquimarina]
MQHERGSEVGQWWWDPDSRRLRIEPDRQASLDEIGGVWTLDSLGVVLDGLSRSRLARMFDMAHAPNQEVACALGLSTGRAVRLVGAFGQNGRASGRLFRAPGPELSQQAGPGPDLDAVFQPIVSLVTGHVAGFEALARWDGESPEDHSGDPSMDEGALAQNMLIRASEALATWCRARPERSIFVNVNLTGRDLASDDLPNLVEALISSHGFEPGQLRIELTEQAALRDAGEAIRVARALKEVGAGVVLDDFGSGHSSFSWLAALPADGLKIDPELTRQIEERKVRVILETVTLLASRLGMSATAEGIEDLKQISLLRSLGFHYAQGFAFSHPVSAAQALNLLDP